MQNGGGKPPKLGESLSDPSGRAFPLCCLLPGFDGAFFRFSRHSDGQGKSRLPPWVSTTSQNPKKIESPTQSVQRERSVRDEARWRQGRREASHHIPHPRCRAACDQRPTPACFAFPGVPILPPPCLLGSFGRQLFAFAPAHHLHSTLALRKEDELVFSNLPPKPFSP